MVTHALAPLRQTPNSQYLIADFVSKVNANITRIQSFCNYPTSEGQNWKHVRIHTNTKKKKKNPQLWLYNERILYVTESAMNVSEHTSTNVNYMATVLSALHRTDVHLVL